MRMRDVGLQGLTSLGRWKSTFLVALVVFSASTSSAAPEKYDFKLKMSQDKQLCPAITEVLSSEYTRHAIDAAPSHNWFIQWQTFDTLSDQLWEEPWFHDSSCQKYRWATFDIDNDGQSEIVIKISGCLGGKLTDDLLIFSGDEAKEHIYQTLMDLFAPSPSDSVQGKINRERQRLIGKISLSGEMYELRKLPSFKDKRGRNELDMYHAIGGQVRIYPFVFDAHTYLNMHGNYGSTWHVIARYGPGEKTPLGLEDICYIRRLKQ